LSLSPSFEDENLSRIPSYGSTSSQREHFGALRDLTNTQTLSYSSQHS
jgi:hypothetical protein